MQPNSKVKVGKRKLKKGKSKSGILIADLSLSKTFSLAAFVYCLHSFNVNLHSRTNNSVNKSSQTCSYI